METSIFIYCAPMVIGKGGMERTAAAVANHLAKKNKVTIGYIQRNDNDKPAYPLLPEINHLPWKKELSNDLAFYREKIIAIAPDCVIDFGASCQSMKTGALLFGTWIPLIVHEGSNPNRILTNNWSKPRKINLDEAKKERNIHLSQASVIRFTLDEYKDSVPEALLDRTVAFPNGFSSTTEISIKRTKYIQKKIINIGGLKPNKNIELLINAFDLIKNKFKDWEVNVFSNPRDANYCKTIKKTTSEKGLSGIFNYNEEVEDIDSQYENSSIHVITSLEEGFSSSVAEAMIHGLPSIGIASCDGVKQLIDHNINGFLVDSQNPYDLASKLALLMSSISLREDFGKNAQKKSLNFSPERAMNNWDTVIQKAIVKMQDMKKTSECKKNTIFNTLYTKDAFNLYSHVYKKPFLDIFQEKVHTEKNSLPSNNEKKDNNSPKNVLIFAAGNLFDIGGIQRSYQFLTKTLISHNYKVTMVAWNFETHGKQSIAYPLDKNIEITLISQKLNNENFTAIKSILQEKQIDLAIIINSTQNSLFFSAACIETNTPFIQSLRGSYEYCLRYLWRSKTMLDLAMTAATKCHVLMPSYLNEYQTFIKNKTSVIPSPIQKAIHTSNTHTPNSDNRYIILYAGRLSFEKQVNLLIESFFLLSDSFSNWDLWIYGDGPKKDQLAKQVDELNIKNRVKFSTAKNTDDMYAVYPLVHIFALPSEQEGCPMAMREAMSHSVPAIAFKSCSGANEIIQNEINGVLVDSDNFSAIDFAVGLKKMMNNQATRTKYAEEAKKTADQFDPDIIGNRWLDIICEAINDEFDQSVREETKNAREIISIANKNTHIGQAIHFCTDEELFKKHEKEYLTLYGSTLFDQKYYLEKYFDVKKTGIDPLLHYIAKGWHKGFNPSPFFDNNKYIEDNPDSKHICPLFHYYTVGLKYDAQYTSTDLEYFEKRPIKPKKIEVGNDILLNFSTIEINKNSK